MWSNITVPDAPHLNITILSMIFPLSAFLNLVLRLAGGSS